MPNRGPTLHHLYPAFIPLQARLDRAEGSQSHINYIWCIIAGRTTVKYLKMFLVVAVYENLRANLCCSSWMRPEETKSVGLWDVLGKVVGGVVHYSFKWEWVPVLCLSPTSCQTGPDFFPSPIVLSLRGELDYTNLEVVQPQPHGRASSQFSGLNIFVNGSQGFRSGYYVALHLFL